MPEIQFFHAQDRNGNLITIAAANKDSDGPFSCPTCHREMVARNVKQERQRVPYFAHKHIDGLAVPPTCYDHEEHLILQDAIMEAFQSRSNQGTPYLAQFHCDVCGRLIHADLTKAGKIMRREEKLDGLRPDLTIRDEAGRVRCAIEIVIKHALPDENVAKYATLDIPVFVVYYAIPDGLRILARKCSHARQVVSEWLPVSKMLGKQSHVCIPTTHRPVLTAMDPRDIEYSDRCTLPPIDEVARQDIPTPKSARSKHNLRQIPLSPEQERGREAEGFSPVNPLAAARHAEELAAIPETATRRALCPIHGSCMEEFAVDISLKKCPRCHEDVLVMTLCPRYFEAPTAVTNSGRFTRWFSPPAGRKFIEAAALWGVSLQQVSLAMSPSGYFMSCCPSCSNVFHWLGTWPCAEPYEFLLDRRHFYWCPTCNKYWWSGQMDDLAEKWRDYLEG